MKILYLFKVIKGLQIGDRY